MASNGGTLTVEGAAERPTQLLMSGPVAGIIGGIAVGKAAGYDSVITLDVGGTSADIGVAPGGQLRMKHLYDTNLGGYDVMVSMVGSRHDRRRRRLDRPASTRAACCASGRRARAPTRARSATAPGGTEPTATDAQVGSAGCAPRRGSRAASSWTWTRPRVDGGTRWQLGMDAEEAALGVTQIVTQNMVNAISINSVQRGFDPRDFSLVAFGGGGPLYGVDIARELSIPRVIVPLIPASPRRWGCSRPTSSTRPSGR